MLGDLRHAVRALRRSPGFATIASLTLALGIGVTTMVFSLLGEPLVPVAVATTMSLIGLIATWAPARRMRSLDPARTLRAE